MFPILFGDSALKILHTNDTEGNWYQSGRIINEFQKVRAALPKKIEEVGTRNKLNQDMLTLHAGDMAVGTDGDDIPIEKTRFYTTVKIWEKAGLDAFVPGNHDQDQKGGLELLDSNTQKYFKHDNMKQGNQQEYFPTLGLNFITGRHDPNFPNVVIKRFQHGRVKEPYAIVGLTLPNVQHKVMLGDNSSPVSASDVRDSIQAVKKTIKELDRQGVKRIIVLSHMGLNNDIELAREVSEIDVIVGGHTHINVPDGIWFAHTDGQRIISQTLLVQTLGEANYYGEIDAIFDDEGHIDRDRTHVTIKEPTGEVHPAVRAIIEDYLKTLPDNPVIATFANEHNNGYYKVRQNPVAQALADGMRKLPDYEPSILAGAIKNPDWPTVEREGRTIPRPVDIALLRSSMFRSSLEKGPFTKFDLNEFLPFPSKLIIIKTLGENILSALNVPAVRWTGTDPRIGQDPRTMFPSGLHYSFDTKRLGGQAYNISDRSGQPIYPDKEYIVALNYATVKSKDDNDFPSLNERNPNVTVLWEGRDTAWLMEQVLTKLSKNNTRPIEWAANAKNQRGHVTVNEHDPKQARLYPGRPDHQYMFSYVDNAGQQTSFVDFGVPPKKAYFDPFRT